MKFTESNTEETSLIELTPLIDVVFLLLIFFMVTTTFTKESEIKIRLPEANVEEPKVDITNQLEILVSKESAYAMRKPGENEVVSLVNSTRETLYRSMSEFQNVEDVLLVIRADKEASHQSVVQVMDVARDLNLSRITFATQGQ